MAFRINKFTFINALAFCLLVMISCEDEKEKTPPEIEIVSMANGDHIYEIALISWTVADESGIAKTELWINGVPLESDTLSPYILSDIESDGLSITRCTYTYEWNTIGLGNDIYKISFFAEDELGNSDFSETINVQVDNSLGVPDPVQLVSVLRDGYHVDVVWSRTDIMDFSKYIIEISQESDMGQIIVSDSSESIDDTSKTFNGIDPTMDIYLSVELVDVHGFSATSQILTLFKDDSPVPVILSAIEYDTTRLVIDWTPSNDDDFESYGVYVSSSSDLEGIEILNVTDKSTTIHEIYDFNPNQQSWYSILTSDTLGQSSRSNHQPNNINLPPSVSEITSIEYDFDSLKIEWDPSLEFDFSQYVILRSENHFSDFLPILVIDDNEQNSCSLSEFDPTIENWFKVQIIDHWSLITNSEPMSNELDPPPVQSDIIAVTYNNDSLIIEWEQNFDQDFLRFEVLYSEENPDDFQILEIIDDPMQNSLSLFSFDPTIENWFTLRTIDHWGQTVTGTESSNEIDPFPQTSDVTSVNFEDNAFNVEWMKNEEGDFHSYALHVAPDQEMTNSVVEYYSEIIDDTTFSMVSEEGVINYFQIGVKDIWGQETLSEPKRGSSYLTFTRSYGGDLTDIGRMVIHAGEGQCVITGSSSSYGSSGLDAFITKKDISGEDIWLEVHGGVNPEQIWDVLQTPDNGYLILGSTESYGSTYTDLFLAKVDQDGLEEWINTYGGSGHDEGRSVIRGSDGNYYMVGSTKSFGNGENDVWLLVVDQQGNELHSHTFGNELNNYGIDLLESPAGGFMLLSHKEVNDAGDHDIIMRKIDSEGLEVWVSSFDLSGNDLASALASDASGTYIVSGSVISNGQKDGVAIGFSEDGSVLFSEVYGGNGNDWFNDIIFTSDGNYTICGTIEGDDYDSWVLKIDPSGAVIWQRNIGLSGTDHANGISELADGGFVLTGHWNEDGNNNYILIKTDSEGYSTEQLRQGY